MKYKPPAKKEPTLEEEIFEPPPLNPEL